jgi:hypothetical protein
VKGLLAVAGAAMSALAMAVSPVATPPVHGLAQPSAVAGSLEGSVRVVVTGPAGWTAPSELILEVGSSAWLIARSDGGGTTSYRTSTPVAVRLVRMPECVTVATFVAAPGTSHVIRFAANGAALVTQNSSAAHESGPLLGKRAAPTGCAPPTAVADGLAQASKPGDEWSITVVVVAALLALAMLGMLVVYSRQSDQGR